MEEEHSFGIIPYYLDLDNNQLVFFVGRRTASDGRVGFWKFPKGHPEPEDDSQLETALRECEEEIGLSLSETDLLTGRYFVEQYEYTRQPENKRGPGTVHKVNRFWLGRVAEPGTGLPEISLQPEEFSEFNWVSKAEILELLPDNGRQCFLQAFEFLTAELDYSELDQ